MISNVVKNSWNWKFADFGDLDLILPEAAPDVFYIKKVFVQNSQ